MLLQNKKQLPILEASDVLPTGKHHVSYSELNVFLECSYKHKLQYIDNLRSDPGSIHTEYGQVVHDLLENYIVSRKLPTEQEEELACEDFVKRCSELTSKYDIKISANEIEEFKGSIKGITAQAAQFLDESFPGWEPVAAEYNLYEAIQGTKNRWFKGYIDSVIRIPRKRAKKAQVSSPASKDNLRFSDLTEHVLNDEQKPLINNIDWEYIIIDWKTTGAGWTPDKKRDFNKQLQLVLYKHYFCNIYHLDLSDVKCMFVLLKRKARKSDGSRIEAVPVSVGPKTEEKGVALLNSMIKQVASGRVIKNRNSCRYCPYYGTKHCI